MAISPNDITGLNKSQVPPYTNHPQPNFTGTTSPNVSVELLLFDPASGTYKSFPTKVTTTSDAIGSFTLQFPLNGASPYADGDYKVEAIATNVIGPSKPSNVVEFILKTHGPTTAPTLILDPSYDSGIVGDNITNVRKPFFDGTIGAANVGAFIQLFQVDSSGNPILPALATTIALADGSYKVQLPFSLKNGMTQLVATAVDAAGNPAPGPSTVLPLTLVTVSSDYSGNLLDYHSTAVAFPAPASSINLPIPDATTTPGTLNSTLNVLGYGTTFSIAGIAVTLNVTHTSDADLGAVLIGPDGVTRITLFAPGTLSGQNLSGLTFSDTATTPVTAGTAPYTGTFQPASPLGVLLGKNAGGTWTLQLTDNTPGHSGTLLSWSLIATPKATSPAPTNPPQPAQSEAVLFERDSTSTNGLWFAQPSQTSNVPLWFANNQALGTANDAPMQGDFDGDGKIDLATYNPATATWVVLRLVPRRLQLCVRNAQDQCAGRRQL